MTFQLHVKIWTWYKNAYHIRWRQYRSTLGRRTGRPANAGCGPEPSTFHAVRMPIPGTGSGDHLANNTPVVKYGKGMFRPITHTGKSETQNHTTAYIWYDELIVSASRIPDPD